MAIIKNVTELDFDQIKSNLKVFLSSQDKFNDYDFDGSGLNVLLDVLAYNTQYNALLAHMATNESFLDSAQLRQNVVSHAKSLGYLPKSRRCSSANLQLVVTGDAEGAFDIQIPRWSAFSSIIGNKVYNFITEDSYTSKRDTNNQYTFNSIIVKEGKVKTVSYRVTGESSQKFAISDSTIDTSTLDIKIRDSLTASEYVSYTHYKDISEINTQSKVYFIQENSNGMYEFYFGDGILGYKPTVGQVVEISYISTNGIEGNGAKTFSSQISVGGYTSISIQNNSLVSSNNGTEKEDINSIKYNAPKLFSAQNRAVTAEDYVSILKAEFDFIEDISIWGGETASPPVYGKVFMSIKPIYGYSLSLDAKNTVNNFLTRKNVGSITTEILDPDYTFISMDVSFKYNSNETNLSQDQLESGVRAAIISYNDNELEKFDGVLRFSNLLNKIDNVDQGILNTAITLKMHKHIIPSVNQQVNYLLKFSAPLYRSTSIETVITSSQFTYNGETAQLYDTLIVGDVTKRKVFIKSAFSNLILNPNAGYTYPDKGIVELNAITFQSVDEIMVFCDPNSNDIAPKFNQLVSIEYDNTPGINITSEEDTIAMLGSTAAGTYTTFSRH